MKKFIAFSGGVESTTMCLIYGNIANAIFADTGYEHKKLYERLELVEAKIQEFHKSNDFKIIRIQSKYGTLPDYIKKTKFYPSFNARYCTRMFKIEPIDEFLKQFEGEGVELMIGLNADEVSQRTGNHGNLPFVKYTYPLADNGITRKKCEELLEAANLHPHFPPYMKRGGCVGCFYKSKQEYEAMVHLAIEEMNQVIDIENSMQDKKKEFYAIKKDIGSMERFKNTILAQGELFDPQEIYSSGLETKCGVFCNR